MRFCMYPNQALNGFGDSNRRHPCHVVVLAGDIGKYPLQIGLVFRQRQQSITFFTRKLHC